MTDWHHSDWYSHRIHAENLEDGSLRADHLPAVALEGLAASQWMHALLRTRYEQRAGDPARENRVARVLDQIEAERSGWTTRTRWIGRVSLVLAASLMLMAGWWIWDSPPSAMAEFERVRQAMLDDTPRRFRVEMEFQGLVATRTLPGELTVRGARQFVFRGQLPLGREFLIGLDGNVGWGVPPVGPVVVSPDPALLQRWAERFPGRVHPQFLHIDTVLARMATDYELKHGRAADKRRVVIEGTRRATLPPRFPDEVRLEADYETGVIQHLEMKWTRQRPVPHPKRITLQFEKEVQVESSWFSHRQHHDESQPVWELEEQNLSGGKQ